MRIWVCALVGLVLFARQDVLLWATIFERDELWQYIGIYHEGWFVMMWGLVVAGFLWTWPNWKKGLLHGTLLVTLVYSGLEDVLYYVLQGKTIPDMLPWLDQHPLILFSPVTRGNLLVNCGAWLAGWVLICFFLYMANKRSSAGAAGGSR